MNPYDSYIPQKPPKVLFPTGKGELLFALGCLVSGLMLINSVYVGGFQLGFAVAAILSIGFGAGYLLSQGCKANVYGLTVLGLCAVIAGSFARADDGFVKFVMVCFLLLGTNLGFCLLAGKNRRAPGGLGSLNDAGYTCFHLGFGQLGTSASSLMDGLRNGGSAGRKSGAVLLGLCLCIPVLAVMIPLLMRADAAFEALLDRAPSVSFGEIFATVLFGSILALFQFSRGTALKHHTHTPLTAKDKAGLSPLTVNTVLCAVCLLYWVYLLSQLSYFIGGFAGLLPQEYTLAEYARRGFFEMALLCAINLGLIILALSLSAPNGRAPLSTRLLCLFVGLATLFFVAAASAKMFLYIDSFGLTRLRVLTQVIMCFLGLVTVFVCIWLFVPKLPYMKAVVLTALIIGALVSWTDVDTQVAKYNVDAYLSGQLETVDMPHLSGLGKGAIPHILRLAQETEDATLAQTARNILNRYKSDDTDLRGWNYVNQKAEEILESLTK